MASPAVAAGSRVEAVENHEIHTSSAGCATKVAKWAFAFFILSGVVAGMFYAAGLTDYLPIPYAVAGLALVVGSIAACRACMDRRAAVNREVPRYTATVTAADHGDGKKDVSSGSSDRMMVSLKEFEGPKILQMLTPHVVLSATTTSFHVEEVDRVKMRQRAWNYFGWVYKIVNDVLQNRSGDLKAQLKEALKKSCFDPLGSAADNGFSSRGWALINTNFRPIFIERPETLTDDPDGLYCTAALIVGGGPERTLNVRRGLVAQALMEIRVDIWPAGRSCGKDVNV